MQIHPIIKTSPSLSSLSWGPSAPPYTELTPSMLWCHPNQEYLDLQSIGSSPGLHILCTCDTIMIPFTYYKDLGLLLKTMGYSGLHLSLEHDASFRYSNQTNGQMVERRLAFLSISISIS